MPRSDGGKSGSTSNHCRAVWEQHLLWQCWRCAWNSAGVTGMIQESMEIIATTYRSTTVKTHVFTLYSHLCNYVSIYLCIYKATHLHMIYLDLLQVVLESNSRCAWKWQSSELRQTGRCRDWACLEMHWEAVIAHMWRLTERPWSTEIRDGLRDRDRPTLLKHQVAMIIRSWSP